MTWLLLEVMCLYRLFCLLQASREADSFLSWERAFFYWWNMKLKLSSKLAFCLFLVHTAHTSAWISHWLPDLNEYGDRHNLFYSSRCYAHIHTHKSTGHTNRVGLRLFVPTSDGIGEQTYCTRKDVRYCTYIMMPIRKKSLCLTSQHASKTSKQQAKHLLKCLFSAWSSDRSGLSF